MYRQPSDEPDEITLGLIAAYAWGIAAVLLGVSNLRTNPSAGVLFILAGVVVLPHVRRWYERLLNIRMSRWALVAVSLAFYAVGAVLYSVLP